MMKNSIVLAAAVASILATGVSVAGGLSANVGIASDYHFRGIDQGVGATASGGLDYDMGNGVSVGTWMADVTDGIEYDLYGSYAGSAAGMDYSVGYTTYRYTGDFDDTYNEVNLGISSGDFSVDYADGDYEGDDSEYTFLAASYSMGAVSATYGTWGGDAEGSYVEVGVTTSIGGGDASVSLIDQDADMGGDTSMVFSYSTSVDL